ncbi:hypothetical protein LTR70_008354 [Exophiala xenobiotica]|uniref:Probable E3 ubiquitin ligase complex SCF subunit sconB n=1 Tax=Lithohypha guttulata TaxID=1690604 RepID=A0ABR0JZ12_9EURO|nr:hypothetical protein LTR24_008991 [Lithohypha guttulata]KAK5312174.1 hypothetical protein LTR70_008354 [Exophiala xenobiotica]
MEGPFKLDEGFAEGSQNGDQVQNSFVAWLNTQSERAKAEIAFEILRTLRSTDIAAVVERLNPLLHMDPIEKLPPEITSLIFSYLDASTLLTASLSSATWRDRILDPRLWQQLYKSEGWGIDLREVRAFEAAHTDVVRSEFQAARDELKSSFAHKGQPLFKRRATSDWPQSTPRRVSATASSNADAINWAPQHGHIEADEDAALDGRDEVMLDVAARSPQRPNKRQSQDDGDDQMDLGPDPADTHSDDSNLLLIDEETGKKKLNWPYLYKQRHKLEQNWLKGRYTNFQLPHPNFVSEAHNECVYTIQFYGKWLVSGSRDKSVRIWDLETRRLRGRPLVGHLQSVLCLQFDPSEEEDIIISGSSDSSIIIWKFSTGQRLQTIQSAHEESVLNLRFDHRYLVTCSKDKKIKVWNRKQLLPTDPDYPHAKNGINCKVPSYIVDLTGVEISTLETRMANGAYRALKPFTHLMTFEGHSAAVNAIQIHGNKIVSASGDRLIRVWNISTGMVDKVISGHQKGIACVQYDGKRIVSGSSDNTVRIYDPNTATEVAVLLGHTNLVRTVQAGFADVAGSEKEELAAARAAERQYRQDVDSGKIVEDRLYSRRLRAGELGSSRVTLGSNLPPGGGGSKWARIVSGSYDESIIIWKKDPHGHWVAGQTLKQEKGPQDNNEIPTAADRAARLSQGRHLRHDDAAVQQAVGVQSQSNMTNQAAITNAASLGSGNAMSASQIAQAITNTSMASLQASVQNIMGISRNLGAAAGSSNGTLNRPAIESAMNQITAHAQAVTTNAINNALINGNRHASVNANISVGVPLSQAAQQQFQQRLQAHVQNMDRNAPSQQGTSQAQLAATQNQAGRQPAPNNNNSNNNNNNSNNNNNNHNQNQNQNQNQNRNQNQSQSQHQGVSRVFKLQFDARRIVCCSQDTNIIVWDFANNDPEIEECARFFNGP